MTKIHLDTDIGGDMDDLCALQLKDMAQHSAKRNHWWGRSLQASCRFWYPLVEDFSPAGFENHLNGSIISIQRSEMIERVGQRGRPYNLCRWKKLITLLCCAFYRLKCNSFGRNPLIEPRSLRKHGYVGQEQPIVLRLIAPRS